MLGQEYSLWERVRAAVPVAAVHALLALALLYGLAGSPSEPATDRRLRLIEFTPEPIPPEPPPPPPPTIRGHSPEHRAAAPRPEGAAAPPNLEAQPTPVVAPEPVVPIPRPSPVPAAPIAGTGTAPSAGAAPVPGPGTGSGGVGNGTGSGRGGNGGGGGGGDGGAGEGMPVGELRPPRQIGGRLSIGDLPEQLREQGFRGRVWVLYRVEANGRVTNCRVTRSSGNRQVDATTCRLIEQRFRYAPARDARGRPFWSQIEEFHEYIADAPPPGEGPPPRRRRPW